jgi:hypothetical protein
MKTGRGNRSTRRKPTPAPLCPPQIPTWPDLGSNPGRRCVKPATNRLSYGTVWDWTKSKRIFVLWHVGFFLIASDHQLYSYSTQDAVRIVNPFITIPITRNDYHTQLFLTLCYLCTAYKHLSVRDYSHLLHSYTYTLFTCTTLIFTALLHITSSLADFSAINYYLKLSPLPVSVSHRDLTRRTAP